MNEGLCGPLRYGPVWLGGYGSGLPRPGGERRAHDLIGREAPTGRRFRVGRMCRPRGGLAPARTRVILVRSGLAAETLWPTDRAVGRDRFRGVVSFSRIGTRGAGLSCPLAGPAFPWTVREGEEAAMVSMGRVTREEPRISAALTAQVRAMARPLRGPEDLDPLLDADRRRPIRAPGRGLARDGRVLHLAGRDQPATDRREGLLLHRGRGRLARLRPRQPLRQGPGRRGRERPRGAARLRAMADLDVGQRGGRRAGRVAPSSTTTAGPTTRRSASTGWTCTACGSRCTPSWPTSSAPTRRRCRPPGGRFAASSPTARTCRNTPAQRGSCPIRARTRWSTCSASCAGASAIIPPMTGRRASPPSRTPWCSRTPRPSTGR